MSAAPGSTGGPRWEVGSEPHLLLEATAEPRAPLPWEAQGLLLGSGRDALRVLLAHGQRALGWRRVWLPTYLCPEVVEAAHGTGLEVRRYACAPFGAVRPTRARAGPGEVVLQVEYFGLGGSTALPELRGAALVEDHTHDPASPRAYASRADFCLASLRKTLPLPDGGALWSPTAQPLPPCPPAQAEHLALAAQKLTAMTLKALYLAGGAVDKATFRALAVEAERGLGRGAPSAMSEVGRALLHSLPVARWRAVRRENHRALCAALGELPHVRVAQPGDPAGCSPLCAVLLFDSPALREQVRAQLLQARIYPAILWPLEPDAAPEVGPAERALSRTLLSLPCDVRYGPQVLAQVAAHVRAAVLRGAAEAAADAGRQEAAP